MAAISVAQFKVDQQKIPIVHAKRRALIIGASKYEHLGKLTYSGGDAKRFRDALVEGFRFKADSIKFLSDAEDGALKPTSENILNSLQELLSDPILDKGDLFILYFSGHGMGTVSGDYLCATDSTTDNVEKTGLPVAQVVDKLVKAKLRNVVIITDACRAGEKNEFGLQLADLARKANLAVMLGCQPGQKSYESPVLKSGVFTYFLLKALSNPKNRTESGGLWTSRISEKVAADVEQFSRQEHGDNAQKPVAFADPTSDVLIAKFVDANVTASIGQADQDLRMVSNPQKVADELVRASEELFDKNEFGKILDLTKQALSLDSSNMFAAYYASIACTFLGRSGEHEKLCDTMKASESSYFRNLGFVQSDSRATPIADRIKALKDYWGSSPKDELHAVMVWTRARTYLSMELTKQFIQMVLPSIDGSSRVAKFFAGELAWADGKPEAAIVAYESALNVADPEDLIGSDIIVVAKMAALLGLGRHDDLKAFIKQRFDSEKVSPLIWSSSAVFLKAMGNRQAAIEIVRKGIKEPGISEDQAYLAALAVGASIGEFGDDFDALVKTMPYSWKVRSIAAIARGMKSSDRQAMQQAFQEASNYCDDELQVISLVYRINTSIFQDAVKNLGVPDEKFSDAYDIFRVLFFNMADHMGSDFEKWQDLCQAGLSTLQGPATLRLFKTYVKDIHASAEMGADFYGVLFQLAASAEDDKLAEFAVSNPALSSFEQSDMRALYAAYLVAKGDYKKAESVFAQVGKVSEANEIVMTSLRAIFKARSGNKDDLASFLKQKFTNTEGNLVAEGIAALASSDLGNGQEALPHLEQLSKFHPSMVDSIATRCTERYLKLLRASGKNKEADDLLYEVTKVNQVSPGIFNSYFGAKPGIENFATTFKAETHWFGDELYDAANPTHKSQYEICAIGDGILDLTIAKDGTVSGSAQIVDGEKLVITGSVDQFGNLRGKAKGPKLQFDIEAKLVSNEFRKTETFKKSPVGQLIQFYDSKGLATHWMLPDSVLNPSGG